VLYNGRVRAREKKIKFLICKKGIVKGEERKKEIKRERKKVFLKRV
jgi:hypothetical protein